MLEIFSTQFDCTTIFFFLKNINDSEIFHKWNSLLGNKMDEQKKILNFTMNS